MNNLVTRRNGLHLIGTLIECDKFRLADPYDLYNFLCEFPKKIGMRLIAEMENPILLSCYGDEVDPLNVGYTGVGVFYESHFSFHAWPEHDQSVDFDVFSCKQFDYIFALRELRNYFLGDPVGCVLLERTDRGARVINPTEDLNEVE